MTDSDVERRYRKRPIEIEATQWFKNGDHPRDYSGTFGGFDSALNAFVDYTGDHARANGWEGKVVRYYRHPDVPGDRACKDCSRTMHEHGWIDTLEGGHIVCPGDWIITGVAGEHYPCKPAIFDATYERAALAATPMAKMRDAQIEWTVGEPPKVEGAVVYGHTWMPYRWKAYPPKSQQFQSGQKGRWQAMNEYGGWDNAKAPDEWASTEAIDARRAALTGEAP